MDQITHEARIAYDLHRHECLSSGSWMPKWHALSSDVKQQWINSARNRSTVEDPNGESHEPTPIELPHFPIGHNPPSDVTINGVPYTQASSIPPWLTGHDVPRGPRFNPTRHEEGPPPTQFHTEVEVTTPQRIDLDPEKITEAVRRQDARTSERLRNTPPPGAGQAMHDLVEKLQREVKTLRSRYLALDSELTHVRGDARTMRAQVSTLQRQVASHEKAGRYASNANNNLRKRIVALEEKAGYTPKTKPVPPVSDDVTLLSKWKTEPRMSSLFGLPVRLSDDMPQGLFQAGGNLHSLSDSENVRRKITQAVNDSMRRTLFGENAEGAERLYGLYTDAFSKHYASVVTRGGNDAMPAEPRPWSALSVYERAVWATLNRYVQQGGSTPS